MFKLLKSLPLKFQLTFHLYFLQNQWLLKLLWLHLLNLHLYSTKHKYSIFICRFLTHVPSFPWISCNDKSGLPVTFIQYTCSSNYRSFYWRWWYCLFSCFYSSILWSTSYLYPYEQVPIAHNDLVSAKSIYFIPGIVIKGPDIPWTPCLKEASSASLKASE